MEKEFKPISKDEVLKVLEAYFSWKEASEKVKKLNGRGINLHESISERLVCYLNNFSLAIGEGSYDAKSSKGDFIQIKATSNFEDDLSSFGPRSKFDFLHFARFDINKDEVWLYDIPKKELDSIILNKKKWNISPTTGARKKTTFFNYQGVYWETPIRTLQKGQFTRII